LVAAGCGGGGQEGNKATFIGGVKDALEARDAPQPLTNCFAKQLDQRLKDAEVEKAYQSLGKGSDASIAEVARAIGPPIIPLMLGGATACKRQLLRSGEVNNHEVNQAFRALMAP
jgi:hypothetical protein